MTNALLLFSLYFVKMVCGFGHLGALLLVLNKQFSILVSVSFLIDFFVTFTVTVTISKQILIGI